MSRRRSSDAQPAPGGKERKSRSFPLGATVYPGGVNFSVYSKHATLVELLLFEHVDADQPSRVFRLSASQNRTGHYWHIFVPDVHAGQLYGWRVQGPNLPEYGLRFDGEKTQVQLTIIILLWL